MALEGREIISYDPRTCRNRLGNVTGMFEHTQGNLFTITYDDGMTEDITEKKLDKLLNKYGELTKKALQQYNMTDSNDVLCALNRSLPPPPPPPQQIPNDGPVNCGFAK